VLWGSLTLCVAGDVEIVPWDAELADEATVEGYYRLVLAAAAVDRPDELPLMTRAAGVGRLRTPLGGQEAARRWVGRQGIAADTRVSDRPRPSGSVGTRGGVVQPAPLGHRALDDVLDPALPSCSASPAVL
jgi:hypothetical protein